MAGDFQVEGYDVDSLLTANAAGELWLARAQATGEIVALKRLRLREPDGADRLRRLVTLLKMIGHPHLQVVRDHILLDDRQAVVVLEHAESGNLEQLLSGRGELDPGEVVTTIGPSAEALATAHERGIVHGDLTASSILYTQEGKPIVGDVGLLALVDGADLLGASSAEPTPADDVWALAAIAYTALTGEAPTAGRPHRPLAEAQPNCPPGLVHAVEAGLAEPAERRPPAAQFAELVYAACPPAPVRFPVALTLSDADIAEAMSKAEKLAREQGSGEGGASSASGGPATPAGPGQGAPGQARVAGGPQPAGPQGPPGDPHGPGGPYPGAGPGPGTPPQDGPGAQGFPPPPTDPFVQATQNDGRPPSPHAERPGPAFTGGYEAQFDDDLDDEGPRAGRVILIALVVLVVLAGAAGGGYWWWTNRSNDDTVAEQTADPEPEQSESGGVEPGESEPGESEPEPERSSAPPRQNDEKTDPPPEKPERPRSPEQRYRAVLEELDERRAEAYAAADPALLTRVYTPGSDLLDEDQKTVRAYQQAGVRLEGLRYTYQKLSVDSAGDDRVVLTVTNRREGFTQIDASGARTEQPPGDPVRQQITLVRTAGGWRIDQIVDL